MLFAMVTIGAFISGLTGIGGGSLVLAGLMMVYPPHLAIPLHAFNQLAANGLRSFLSWKQINYKVMVSYALLIAPGCYLATLLFAYVNPAVIKLIVGSMILLSAYPKLEFISKTPSLKAFSILGFFSGFLSMFSGAVGPLVLPFFNKLNLSREGSIGTKSCSQLILQIIKIIAFAHMTDLSFIEHQSVLMILITGTIIGIVLSLVALKKVTDHQLDKFVMGLMIVIGGKIFFEGISGLLVSFH